MSAGNARDFPEDGTSTSPEFRNGLVSMGCGLSWYGEDQDTTYITALLQYANEHMYQYGTGVYYNENDYYLQDWQVLQCFPLISVSHLAFFTERETRNLQHQSGCLKDMMDLQLGTSTMA